MSQIPISANVNWTSTLSALTHSLLENRVIGNEAALYMDGFFNNSQSHNRFDNHASFPDKKMPHHFTSLLLKVVIMITFGFIDRNGVFGIR